MRYVVITLLLSVTSGVYADEFETDLAKLQAARQAYSSAAGKLLDDVDSTVAMLHGLEPMAAWADSLKTKHREDVERKSERGRKLESAYAALLRDVKLFVQKRESFEKTCRRDFEQALQRADKMSELAVMSRAKGALDGARGELSKARKIAEVVLALSGKEEATPLARRLKTTMDLVAQRDAELQATLADAAKVPVDAYQGADADELRTLIQAEWRKTHPQDDVLQVVLASNTWQRTIRFSWDRGAKEWDVGDVLVLPARVVVKSDERTATIYMAYVNRHPLTNSQSAGVRTKTADYVQEQIPLAKLE